jgi:hypothetical protein
MALKDMIATKRHAAEKGSECQELPCYPVDVKGMRGEWRRQGSARRFYNYSSFGSPDTG